MKKWRQLLLLLLLVISFMSCRTVQVTSDVYKSKIDTCYITKYSKDSIFLKDSIFIDRYTKNDTIYITKDKWHIRYIDKSSIDTVYLASNDTSYIERTITLPPEKYVPKWIILLLVITGVISIIVITKLIIKLVVKIKSGGLLS